MGILSLRKTKQRQNRSLTSFFASIFYLNHKKTWTKKKPEGLNIIQEVTK